MALLQSARNFLRRIRRDGVGCIPRAVHTRWMVLVHRNLLRAEAARRAAETEAYQGWLRRHTQPTASSFRMEKRLSFLIPTWNTRPEFLAALADSLLAQSCPNWQACFYDGASTCADTRAALLALAERDSRFVVRMGDVNAGISGNTNAAFALATGEVIALCDHDDTLAPDAVRCVLAAVEGGADFVYTDEDKLSEDGTRYFGPHCKPDFSPDALRSGNYICHLMAMTRPLAESVMTDGQLLRPAFDGSQDHDLALRATEKARHIVHIQRILYHWRQLNASYSHQKAEKCARAACAAVQEQLERLNIPASVSMVDLRPRIRYAVPEGAAVTAIVVGQGRIPRMNCPVVRVDDYAQANAAAKDVAGDFLLFLHAGLIPLKKADWLPGLLMHAACPEVGCVGSAILDGRGFYRHAGYAVGENGAFSHHAGQWHYGHPYELTDRIVRNVTGVSSALMMIRRETFLALGGFSDYESDLRGADLGMKTIRAGLVNVYTPHAACRMRNAKCEMRNIVCGADVPAADAERFRAAWGDDFRERYYSPLLTRDGSMYMDMTGREDAP